MIRIGKLIVVEVGKSYSRFRIDRMPFEDAWGIWYWAFTYHQIKLPAPCDIIGLASKIGLKDIHEIMNAAGISCRKNTTDAYARFIESHSLTDDSKDYLFLKIK